MFDVSWLELLFVGILALVIVGPKDLPGFITNLGRMFGKFRRMYRDSIESLHRLQHEIDVASRPPPETGIPEHYALLPEHVKQMLYTDSPIRDPEEAKRREEAFEQAVEEARLAHERRKLELSQSASEVNKI